MKEAFDLVSVRRTLRHMLDKGLIPDIETLDTPSPGFLKNTGPDRRTFPGGYTGTPHRNLLRDHHPETVQAGPSPRDFEPATEADQGSALRADQSHVHMEGAENSDLNDFCPEF